MAAYPISRANSVLNGLLAIYLDGPEVCVDHIRWNANDSRWLYQPGGADGDNGEEEMQITWKAFKETPQSYLWALRMAAPHRFEDVEVPVEGLLGPAERFLHFFGLATADGA